MSSGLFVGTNVCVQCGSVAATTTTTTVAKGLEVGKELCESG